MERLSAEASAQELVVNDLTADAEGDTDGQTPALASEVHWLLTVANPNWTVKELNSAKNKLRQVDIMSFSHLEKALREKGRLNNLLREKNLKVFGNHTLERLRRQIASERERKRQAALLGERRRLDKERRRQLDCLDQLQQRLESSPTLGGCLESTDSPGCDVVCFNLDDDAAGTSQAADGPEAVTSQAADGLSGWFADQEAACEAIAPNGGCSTEPRSDPMNSDKSKHDVADHVAPCHSWEWPLSRPEKNERVIICYKREMDELKSEMEQMGTFIE